MNRPPEMPTRKNVSDQQMITAADFRDSYVCAITVGYDWEWSEHFALITVQRHGGVEHCYRIECLKAWAVFEDFSARYIEQCTLLHEPERVYLCLDPYLEGKRTDDDNFWFVGASVLPELRANNPSDPTPRGGTA